MNIFEEIQIQNSKNLNKCALIDRFGNGKQNSITYKEMIELVNSTADKFKKLGLEEGSRVGIIAPSLMNWTINYLALQKNNMTAVLFDYALEKEEILKLVEKTDLKAVIMSKDVKDKIGLLDGKLNIKISPYGKCYENSSIKKIDSNFKLKIEEDANVSTVIFSSGTTKTASGIMHSAEALVKTTRMTLKTVILNKKDRYLGILPNSHIYGLITQILGPLLSSAKICYLESLDAKNLLSAFKEYQPTVIPGVPKFYELLYTQITNKIQSKNSTKVLFNKLFPICVKLRNKTKINLGKLIFSSVQKGFGGKIRVLASAGSPLTPDVAEFYFGTGFNILSTYGSTETNVPTLGNFRRNITTNSCGKPYPDINIKIAKNGELLIKSPYLMLGYFNDEKTTATAFNKEGWFLTGDLAKINEQGNVEILGRKKENIVLANGKKVAPDDIEKNYQDIPLAKDFAICGIPVQDKGYDEIHCFVVANENDKGEIEEYIKKISNKSHKNMKIAGIHFVEEIPRTALKKPKRFLLRQKISGKNKIQNTQISMNDHQVSIKDIVYSIISKISHVNDLNDEMVLMSDLPIDSLSIIEISCEIERIYGFNIEKAINSKTTIKDIIEIIENPPKNFSTKIKKYLKQFPLKKRNSDYTVFRFYRNIINKLYKVNVENDEQIPENTGYIICSNHVSNFDYMYLTMNFQKERFKKFYCVAKQELFKNNPITKAFVRVFGMIPVDRKGIAAETIRKVGEKMKEKCGVMIFPEGTRSKTGKLGEVKKGVALISSNNNVPIIPAYIRGAFEIYPPNRKLPKLFNWKIKKKYEVSVIYGKPIFPNGKNVEQITKEVNEAILKLSRRISKRVAAT